MAVFRRSLALVIVGALLLLPGCAGKAKQDPAALQGVQWALTASSETKTDLTKLGIYTQFDANTMSGFSGVNSFSGPYTAGADGAFNAGPLASTMMAGPPAAMAAETAYLKLLEAADSFEIAQGKLVLKTPDGASLTFDAASPPALAGSSWLVTGYNNGKQAVVTPVAGSNLTLKFGTDNTVSGSGGVNTFNGPFESSTATISIGPLAATKMAGSEQLMAQEQQYLSALQAASEWEISNGSLTLRNDQGAMQVTAIGK